MIHQKKIFKYLRNFGFYHGLRLFLTVRKSNKKGIITFQLPGLQFPVSIRRDGSDFSVFEEVFVDRFYHDLPRDDFRYLIDAGANVGLTALLFLQRYPQAQIICIEAEADNFKILKKNMRFYPNVICLHNALWCRTTQLTFKNLHSESWAFEVIETNDPSHSLDAVTLNTVLDRFAFPCIDLLKIDIEGSEKEVFETATEWAGQTRYIIVEVHEDIRPGALCAVHSLMKKHNFKPKGDQPVLHFYK